MRTVAGLLVGLFLFIGALTLIVISAIVQAVMGLLPLLLLTLTAVGVVKIIAARRGRASTEPQRRPAVPTPAAVAPPTLSPGYRPPRPPMAGWVLVPVWMAPTVPRRPDVIDAEVIGEEPDRG